MVSSQPATAAALEEQLRSWEADVARLEGLAEQVRFGGVLLRARLLKSSNCFAGQLLHVIVGQVNMLFATWQGGMSLTQYIPCLAGHGGRRRAVRAGRSGGRLGEACAGGAGGRSAGPAARRLRGPSRVAQRCGCREAWPPTAYGILDLSVAGTRAHVRDGDLETE